MFSPDTLTALSKVLSKVLRHEPELIGLKLDAAGFADMQELIKRLNSAAARPGAAKRLNRLPVVTEELVRAVVSTNDKQRFGFSPDGRRIRASQGHSIDVTLGYDQAVPPSVLYHGTAVSTLEAIWKEGLKPMSRHAVHLTEDTAAAMRTGGRHGNPRVLTVAAAAMHQDGFAFTRSDNGVWLVDQVPPRYLSLGTANASDGKFSR